ncbi:haloacid dehalogenase superfamily, subfamily IA, variant 3 with third motif having DD or ED [Agrococcus jejuensis]|uniref:Haloacid dehalogenase superfamily, subfamily IA, variant 3 with third motif having DD or ED n=1 Tax=Agrococcus jejuensis TaxID=399736 RepID=A0A1G8DQR0_9MICO|nr:haloacid dehalogenase superfamily, subfamily IA, variant 3 with third motif having DD or ED [Agrococcus jejuensis]
MLFDCDGVLVDSEPVVNGVLRAMLAELGWVLTPEESMRRFVGRVLEDELPAIMAQTGATLDVSWIDEFRARRDVALQASGVEPIPGAIEALDAVVAAYPGAVACASGADRPKIEMQLSMLGILDRFGGHVLSGQEQARSKPAPDVYLAAAAELGVDPRRCAVVEDTIAGTTAGVAAGATVFAYAPDGADVDGLRAAGASATFASMRALPALLGI